MGGKIIMNETKVCSKCKKEYPLNEDFFPRDSRVKSGFRATCKTCHNGYNQRYKKIYLNNHRQEIYDYNNIHHWIQRRKPKPDRCPMCDNFFKPEELQLSNLSGKYLKDVRDFIFLCPACHLLLDNIFKEARLK